MKWSRLHTTPVWSWTENSCTYRWPNIHKDFCKFQGNYYNMWKLMKTVKKYETEFHKMAHMGGSLSTLNPIFSWHHYPCTVSLWQIINTLQQNLIGIILQDFIKWHTILQVNARTWTKHSCKFWKEQYPMMTTVSKFQLNLSQYMRGNLLNTI